MTRSCERAQRLATCRCAYSRGLRTFKVVTRQRQIRDRRAWLCKRRELMIISIHLQKAHRVVPCSEGCKESLFICRTLTAYPLGELKIISASLFIFQDADRVSSNDAHLQHANSKRLAPLCMTTKEVDISIVTSRPLAGVSTAV
jgi:hypothetical protein